MVFGHTLQNVNAYKILNINLTDFCFVMLCTLWDFISKSGIMWHVQTRAFKFLYFFDVISIHIFMDSELIHVHADLLTKCLTNINCLTLECIWLDINKTKYCHIWNCAFCEKHINTCEQCNKIPHIQISFKTFMKND